MPQGREIIEGPTSGGRPGQERSMGPARPAFQGGGGENLTQVFALVVGLVYLAVGIIGFAVTGFTGVTTNGDDALLGFDLNVFHNVVHLAIGAGFILVSRLSDPTITQGVVIGGGLVYILAALLGFLNELQILSIDDEIVADNFLHLFSGIAAVLFGVLGARLKPWAGQWPPPLPRKGLLAAGAVVAVAVAAGAAVIGSSLVDSPDPGKSPKAKSRGFTQFRDSQAGFSISHPRSWRRLPSADGQVRLIVAGGGASLLVRTAPLGLKVRPETLGSAKKLTDRLVRSVKNVKLLRKPQRVASGGLSGYLYLYTFKDLGTKQRGAHAHYFLFRDETMFTLVFQALPSTAFTGLAPLFDRIANTFRAEPAGSGQR